MLRIDKGQFMCSLDECVIQVKCDKGAVESFSATGPDDGSSTTLFIQNAASFTKRLRTSKTLTIEARFYQEGRRQLEFSPTGLVWK